jgi:hypothetical protein
MNWGDGKEVTIMVTKCKKKVAIVETFFSCPPIPGRVRRE